MKDEVDSERRRREDIKKERDHFKSLHDYMQLKGASRGNKGIRDTSVIDPAEDQSIKLEGRETTKGSKVSELEADIKKLKETL